MTEKNPTEVNLEEKKDWAETFSVGLSKFLFACAEERSEIIFFKKVDPARINKSPEKKVYILRDWFSFRTFIQRKIKNEFWN